MSSKKTSTHNVVILGGSFAGISAAHQLLRNVLPPLNTASSKAYKVTLVSPSAFFMWKIGAPRTIVSPKDIPLDKALIRITDGFKEYDSARFEFVQAAAISVDHGSKKLTVEDTSGKNPSEGREYDISYDSLLISTGVTQSSPLFGQRRTDADTRELYAKVHEGIPKAKTILIAGGGPSGTETAGELGDTYGASKDITILSGSTRLLSNLSPSRGQKAERILKELGVKTIHNVRVTSFVETDGKTRLTLSDGTERTVDVYIPAAGDKPNTDFLPKDWLNERGYVKTKLETLRLDVPGVSGVYVLGSVGSYSLGGVLDVYNATKPCCESIRVDIFNQLPSDAQQTLQSQQITAEMQFVPLGRSHGVGVIFGFGVPQWMVVMLKGKTFMIEKAIQLVQGADYKKA
ncbi:AMID-like mitochondrial oxidoreductase [Xylogone sp. PMI_703]|nr:AMID-like mitochondrial oxidoreductase [Xylogone sp. PMI_703]